MPGTGWRASSTVGPTDAQADDALLVVSELATNALQHGLGDVVVRAEIDDDRAIQLSVTDSGDELPALQPVDPDRVGGLGLRIVDQLAAGVGRAPVPRRQDGVGDHRPPALTAPGVTLRP